MAYFLCCFESEAMSSSDVIWIIICGRTSTVNLKIYICVYYKLALLEESVILRNSIRVYILVFKLSEEYSNKTLDNVYGIRNTVASG